MLDTNVITTSPGEHGKMLRAMKSRGWSDRNPSFSGDVSDLIITNHPYKIGWVLDPGTRKYSLRTALLPDGIGMAYHDFLRYHLTSYNDG